MASVATCSARRARQQRRRRSVADAARKQSSGAAAFITRSRTTRIAITGPEDRRARIHALLEGLDGIAIEDLSGTASLAGAVAGASTNVPDVALVFSSLAPLRSFVTALRSTGGSIGVVGLVPRAELDDASRAAPSVGFSVLPDDAEGEAILAALHGAAHRLVSVPAPLAIHGQIGDALTDQQRRVLALLAQGQSNKQISRVLGISANTTKFHVAALLRRLGVGTRTEAVAVGLRSGLIEA